MPEDIPVGHRSRCNRHILVMSPEPSVGNPITLWFSLRTATPTEVVLSLSLRSGPPLGARSGTIRVTIGRTYLHLVIARGER